MGKKNKNGKIKNGKKKKIGQKKNWGIFFLGKQKVWVQKILGKLGLTHTRLFFYKKHDFKKHEAEITGPVDC